ncbi:exo-beta-N-acetylmuramidase NamZ family protein [Flavobacterium sp. 3HN19-14]|uniref:exo-beta-N-acetylmuramidase NamZ family protein n=1 Tax=Flavobacterium sp. 3HN19-14 TaxID=3448133 RepID=UPI003EDF26D7
MTQFSRLNAISFLKFSRYTTAFLFSILIFSCKPAQNAVNQPVALKAKTKSEHPKTHKVEVVVTNPEKLTFSRGADNYGGYAPLLKDKKVGVLTNQTGIIFDQTSIVDFLISKSINVTKIYAPEHGFRGTAADGELIADGRDVKTGLPIISLYGDNKKPTAAQLAGIDVLIFDLQDVGARFYTYISTLHYAMEACAENNVPLIVFDRPNPNGSIVDGPILEPEYSSFVGMHPIPVLHGMTIGEYARMINGEKWLKNGIQCDLTVVACSAYTREMPYSLLVKPSPNLPNDQAINLYASLCFFEGTNVSVGRGTNKQFQIYGSPYLPNIDFCFIPMPNEGSTDPPQKGKDCFGEDLSNYPKLDRLDLQWLVKAYAETSERQKFFNSYFTKLAGTKKLQQQIESGMTAPEIRASWETGLIMFREMRQKYLIYPYGRI